MHAATDSHPFGHFFQGSLGSSPPQSPACFFALFGSDRHMSSFSWLSRWVACTASAVRWSEQCVSREEASICHRHCQFAILVAPKNTFVPTVNTSVVISVCFHHDPDATALVNSEEGEQTQTYNPSMNVHDLLL